MLIIRFKGGLGNQMFQYAFYQSCKTRNKKVFFDTSFYSGKNYIHNGFELEKVFKLDLKFNKSVLNNSEYIDNKSNFKFREYLGRIFFKDPNKFIKNSHFIENNFSKYNENIYDLANCFLDGYWQSEYYFKDISKLIRKSFTWKFITPKNRDLAEQMKIQNSISLHVRRFDKINSLKDLFYLLKIYFVYRTTNKKYYLRAINLIKKKINNPFFYIFTDDIAWVKKEFALDKNFMIIENNFGNNSYQDMFLMSNCKHNIISMSTFSWWGAWLNNSKDKIVICPQKWAVRFKKDINLIPKNWIRI